MAQSQKKRKPAISPKLAVWSLGALGAGLLLGAWGSLSTVPGLELLADAVSPFGTLWLNSLRMTVIPLVVTQLLASLVKAEDVVGLGVLGGRALVLFLLFLLSANLFTLGLTPLAFSFLGISAELGSAIPVGSMSAAQLPVSNEQVLNLGDWLVGLVPPNPFQAAAEGQIVQVLLFTILFGAAAGRLPGETRSHLATTFKALAEAMMVLVRWVLWGTPVGVFALMLRMGLDTGFEAVGFLGAYLAILIGLLLLATVLLYPVAVLLGKVSPRDFAAGVFPAQTVAASTQSSLASLPALIDGGEERLRLPDSATGFVLPLCVSTFKQNQGISPLFKYLFLAHVFGIQLGIGDIATFIIVSMILSFSVAGVPRGGGGFRTLPLYLAVGIPIEAYVIIEAVKTIPDVFMTLLNVTSDMTVATILSRDSRAPDVASAPDRVSGVPEPISVQKKRPAYPFRDVTPRPEAEQSWGD